MTSLKAMTADPQVLIVGGGPVGLALANELGWRGVPTLLIDEGDGEVVFPAGEAIFSRTMEHLRRWGIAEEVRKRSAPPADHPHNTYFMTTVDGRMLVPFRSGQTNLDAGGYRPYTPEGPTFLSKFEFVPLLRAGAERHPSVELAWGNRLESVEQHPEGVVATVIDVATGARRTIEVAYLAACDGGRSTVRQTIGVELQGTFAEGRNFAIYFRSAALSPLIEERCGTAAVQIHTLRSPRRPYLTMVDGGEHWRCSVYVEGDPTEADAERFVREAVGDDVDVEVIRAQPWSGHRVVAERYREGRVFLVGDAAHLLWPKGGFGANTGIGDAVDLGWKLAAVHQGWGGAHLLDSYEAERRPIAVRNVAEAASNREADALLRYEPELDEDGVTGDEARARVAEQIRSLRAKEFKSIGVQLGYRYDDSPICRGADSDSPPPDLPDVYLPTTYPGARAPHAPVGDGSILDRFGRGFVLCRFDTSIDVGALAAAAVEVGMPLEVLDTSDDDVASAYQQPLVLVRPDGHVAWRGASLPTDVPELVDQVRGAR